MSTDSNGTAASARLGFRHVETIRATMLAGSVTGAAARLHVTQPAVSKLLRDAEDRLGFSLFDRRAGRLVPTAAGQSVFEEIERSFTGLDEINALCGRLKSTQQHQLAIAATPAFAAAVLPPVIDAYRRKVEPAFFVVHSRSTEHVSALVLSGKADIGFSLDAPPIPGLHSEKLAELPVLCYLPPRHRLAARAVVTASSLRGESMITLSQAEGIDAIIARAFRAEGGAPASVLECPAAIAACAMVAAGVGFTLLDPLAAEVLGRSKLAIRAFRPDLRLVFRACWVRSRKPRYAREQLVESARATLADITARWTRSRRRGG